MSIELASGLVVEADGMYFEKPYLISVGFASVSLSVKMFCAVRKRKYYYN